MTPGLGKSRTDSLDAVLGARIRQLRKERNLSQSALGESLGITFQQVQKYENGSNRISALTLVKLASALGVEPTELLMELAAPPNGDGGLDHATQKLIADFQRIRSADLRASVLTIVASLVGR